MKAETKSNLVFLSIGFVISCIVIYLSIYVQNLVKSGVLSDEELSNYMAYAFVIIIGTPLFGYAIMGILSMRKENAKLDETKKQ